MHVAHHNLCACRRQWLPGGTRLAWLQVVVFTTVHNFSDLPIYCRLHLPLHRAARVSALVVAPWELAAFHFLLPIFPPVVPIKWQTAAHANPPGGLACCYMVTTREMLCIDFHLLRYGIRPGILQVKFSTVQTRLHDDTLDSSTIADLTDKYLNLEGSNSQKVVVIKIHETSFLLLLSILVWDKLWPTQQI